MLLLNGLAANMLPLAGGTIAIRPLAGGAVHAATLLSASAEGIESAVGHADTAALFSTLLGAEVRCERRTVELRPGDRAILGAYRGPRLPEGATTLPEGATIEWHLIEVTASMPVPVPVPARLDAAR